MDTKKGILRKVLVFGLVFLLLWARGAKESEPQTGGEEAPEVQGFMDISWTRETPADTETIRFGSDGSFSYSCGCGNPVNDADLCEGYTYDPEAGEITLLCLETTEEMVTVIGVTAWDEDSLTLDFAGETRTFHPA